jgi:hypothetical protein
MAKTRGGGGTKKMKRSASKPKSRAVAVRSASTGGRSGKFDASDAFVKLLQSPLVAELVAIAATAALTALAQQGFTGEEGTRKRKAGNAVKAAGKAAASAVGRRLSTEIDEIRSAAKAARGGAKA